MIDDVAVFSTFTHEQQQILFEVAYDAVKSTARHMTYVNRADLYSPTTHGEWMKYRAIQTEMNDMLSAINSATVFLYEDDDFYARKMYM